MAHTNKQRTGAGRWLDPGGASGRDQAAPRAHLPRGAAPSFRAVGFIRRFGALNWPAMTDSPPHAWAPSSRQPMFNIPRVVIGLGGVLVAIHALRGLVLDDR